MQQPQLLPSRNELVRRSPAEAYPGYADPSYGYSSVDVPPPGSWLEYWGILCRHKLAVGLMTLLGTFAGILLTVPQTSVYQARTTLEIQDLNENFLNIQQVTPVSGGNNNSAPTDIQTQIKLLQSESLMNRTLAKLKDRIPADLRVGDNHNSVWHRALTPAMTPNAPVASSWPGNLAKDVVGLAGLVGLHPRPEGDSAQDPASSAGSQSKAEEASLNSKPEGVSEDDLGGINVVKAARAFRVRATPQTRVVQLTYDSTDPKFAAVFLNTLVQEFINSNMEARWKMSEQTGQWLSRQLDDMRASLKRSEDALQAYARSTGLIYSSDEKTNISEERLRQVQEALSRAQADRIAAQSRWETTKTSPPDTLPEVLGDTSLQTLQTRLAELQRERADLITIYTEKHSKVKRVEAQIAQLQDSLQKERGAIVERLKNDYQSALGREKLLSNDFASHARLVTDQSEKAIQYNILKHEVDSNRQVYETMLQRAKEAGIASAMRASNVRIVDGAEAPRLPYKPSVPLNGALGLFSGLLIGFGYVLVSERSDRTFQSPGESRMWLNVPELQVIPTASERYIGRRFYSKVIDKPITLSLASGQSQSSQSVNGDKGAAPFSVELITWHQKPSVIADSFRSLLTSILFFGENGDRPRLLVLTSAGPGEGKTTVVSNLAIALAEIKQKVLIIDADLRKPRIHELFDLPNRRGLTNLLGEGPFSAESVQGFIQKTGVPGLFVLPAGPASDSGATLLYSQNLPPLLAKLKQEFDTVIIDTPPMLQMPDARVLGRMADGVILVTRAGHTVRDAAAAAHQRFTEDRTRVLGTILNDWNPKGGRDYYGYGRYNSYYHRD